MTASTRRTAGLVRLVVLIVAVVVVVAVLIPSLNPFSTERVDRSQPVVVQSIQDLGELRSASANLSEVIDVEDDTKNVPSFLKGERVLFMAGGTVDASIDLRNLPADAVKISDDRRTATITLPRAKLGEANVDPDKTRVVDRDRGLLDRLGDLVADNPGGEQELQQLAARRLEAAAAADPELTRRAEENARATLTGLLKALGFTKVTINFSGAAPGV